MKDRRTLKVKQIDSIMGGRGEFRRHVLNEREAGQSFLKIAQKMHSHYDVKITAPSICRYVKAWNEEATNETLP